MKKKLVKIDEITRPQHYYLEQGDVCYYYGLYTARQGFSYSEMNSLITNFKKKPSRKGRPEYRYKEKAIQRIGETLESILRHNISDLTFVPVPPSQAKDSPEYDDRLIRTLNVMGQKQQADIRELVVQKKSYPPAHKNEDRRLRPADRAQRYSIDERLAILPLRKTLIIFDDIITTGSSYKAINMLLSKRFPGQAIHGLFVARCVHLDPIEEFDELLDE